MEACLNHHKEFRRLVLLVTWLELLRERDLWLLRDEVDGLVRASFLCWGKCTCIYVYTFGGNYFLGGGNDTYVYMYVCTSFKKIKCTNTSMCIHTCGHIHAHTLTLALKRVQDFRINDP